MELPNFSGRLTPVSWAKPFTFSAEKRTQLKVHADPKCRVCIGVGIVLNQRNDEMICACVHQEISGKLE